MRGNLILARYLTLLAALGVAVDLGAQIPDCQNYDNCAVLTTGTGEELEPSGLVWLPELQVVIAVSDDPPNAPGFELFYFRPGDFQAGRVIAYPLLTEEQSRAYQLEDLEGLAWNPENGSLWATGSLSLDADSTDPEDSWRRHQLVEFRIRSAEGGGLRASHILVDGETRRRDLREWLISGSTRQWTYAQYSARAEAGGINVEGLETDPCGNLLLALRGPLDSTGALALRFTPAGSAGFRTVVQWVRASVRTLPGSGEELERGFRGVALIPDEYDCEDGDQPGRYVVALGHTGGRFDALRLATWNAATGAVADRGALPNGFVGEGVVVTAASADSLTVLVVSDRGAKVLQRRIAR